MSMYAWVYMKSIGQAWISSLISSLNLRQDFPLKLAIWLVNECQESTFMAPESYSGAAGD